MTSARCAAGLATVKYHDDRLSMTRPWTNTTVAPWSVAPRRWTCMRMPLASTSAIGELRQRRGHAGAVLDGEEVAAGQDHQPRVGQDPLQAPPGRQAARAVAVDEQRRTGQARERVVGDVAL